MATVSAALRVDIKTTLLASDGAERALNAPLFTLDADPTLTSAGRGTVPLSAAALPLLQVTVPKAVWIRWISGPAFDVGVIVAGTFHPFSRVDAKNSFFLPAHPAAVYAWRAAVDPAINPASAEFEIVNA